MTTVAVRITRLLADIAGTGRTVTVEATTAGEALEALCRETPALRVHVFDETGDIRHHVNVFVRGELIRDPSRVPVADGDEIAVVQAVSGGAAASP